MTPVEILSLATGVPGRRYDQADLFVYPAEPVRAHAPRALYF